MTKQREKEIMDACDSVLMYDQDSVKDTKFYQDVERIIYDRIDMEKEIDRLNELLKEQQKTGRWFDDGDPMSWKCSKCDYKVSRHNNTPFCPNCGTKMER